MDALTPQQVPEARFVLSYQHRNISHDISQHLLSLTYSDFLTGQADSLDVELEDTDGKWIDAWYPGHGDMLTLSLGWQGKPLRTLGNFEIDEVELNAPPSTVNIRALGAGIQSALRTTEYRAYENTTLDAVARQVAARQGLELVGRIEPIKLDRLTQQDSDLTFLRNLAGEYDYAFKVTGKRMVFHAISDLAKGRPVASLVLKDLTSVRVRDQITVVPKKVAVKHKDPVKKKLISYDIVNGETVAVPSSTSKTTTSADTKKQRKRAASEEVAKARAKADLAKANRERTTGGWTAMGRPELVSGNVVTLVAAGKMGGDYLITAAHHRLTRSGGYTVDQEVCRVAAASIAMTRQNVQPDLALSSYGPQREVVA
ncbi:phage late control D family protein [Pseudomonas rubra]|uniref:Contractile injection system protein, VgrG/Pvc8 family n=1 Tax=Pseudomonas rubra TaxID=2942627 RepID=A0ABT5PET5_9PSED|nr:contractile injection system protein, VgrG/Pvc8 family [Pseudomonas rubra]MDD1016830.1 contractile injection system protein, VgrG/Pvc8 family [Pseudomonas rubra]MDD1041469.1 contractile injection system protein, VgrG/Pvc8 family [Pseudomonas rubra]MDD1154974.1 contractile injection system protein, VgrG/Pvc8 family [Pseudomonas rubra]